VIVESLLLVWEVLTNRAMRKLDLKGYHKSTEEERRRKWSKKLTILSFAGMFVFIVLLILGVALTSGRECSDS